MVGADVTGLGELLEHRARVDPARLAFVHRGRQLSFGELADRAGGRAGRMRDRGVVAGDRVAIAMTVGLPFVETFWGLALLGAAPCVFNPAVPGETLRRRLSLVRPALVVTSELAEDLQSTVHEPTARVGDPEDLAFLQLTSGTSGAPRASMILQRNVMGYLRTSRSDGWLDRDHVFVSWAPPWHDLGLVRFVIAPVYHGCACHIVEPAVRTIPEWLATISEVRGTYSAAPDFAFRLAVRMVDSTSVDLSSLRLMKSGGEPVRQSTVEEFERHFGISGVMAPGYGLGEATLGVSEHLPGDEISVDERGNLSCGPPNDGLEVRAGSGLDATGEILVRGDAVFAGYFDAPEETRRTLRDGWLHTGDDGYLDEQGRLFVLGRREGMLKRAGAVIAPRELEEAAARVPDVRVAAAIGVPSAKGGDDLVVAVEADVDEQRSSEQVAADVSREIVAALGFAPGRVTVLPRRAIPRTENGKIRHARLRSLLERGPA